MSNITVKFIGKEYTVPEDILTYIDLLDFTDNIQKRLANAFVRKLKSEISKGNVACLDDKVMAPDVEQQVGKFIAKLTEHGIYDRTINDYLRENEGYKLISKVNAAALDEAKRVFQQQISDWIEGYEDAIQKKDASVTGLSFSILSGSFVNHAIYAAMEASKVNEQEKAAAKEYQKDMAELDARLASRKNEAEKQYVANTYIPHMEAAITVFSYELLDTFISDLIKCGKINKDLLNYVHIDRSNDLLKNLELSQNKEAVLLKAFEASPYNIAVYMRAMKYDLLDYDTFQTAKVFKQDHLVLSFFRENWGEVSYPTKFKINYHCINVWATLTDQSSVELLRGLTDRYATNIVQAYSKVANMLSDKQFCRKVIGDCSEDAILEGDTICKAKAHYYVDTIVSPVIWSQLTEKCGHLDLFERVKKGIVAPIDTSDKDELDKYLFEQIFLTFANERRLLAEEIIKRREAETVRKAEREKQQRERRIRNKKIASIVITIMVVVAVFVVLLSTVIIPSCKYIKAVSLEETGDYYAAIKLYSDIGGYKDATERCVELWENITVRDTISAEYRHTVALKENGTVVAVGDTQYGRTDVSSWIDVIAVSAGGNYTLGLKANGTVLAVGANSRGQCDVKNWREVVAISAGTDHSVGLISNGTVVAVGDNQDDQCEVSDWSDIIAITTGDYHTVGLKTDGTVVATGETRYGSCDVEDWTDIIAISAASLYTIGLKSDGTVVAVGDGKSGLIIEYVEEWTDIIAVSAGDKHILGLKSDGTVIATGENDEGQCNVSEWRNIVAIAAGYEHSIGLMADGTVVAVGDNAYGQCDVSKWKDIKLSLNDAERTDYLADKKKIDYASKILGRRCDESGNISLNADLGNFINGDNPLFGESGHFELGAYYRDSKGLKIDTLDWKSNGKVKDFSKTVSALHVLYGEPFYISDSGKEYKWKDVGIYENILCVQNNNRTVTIRWEYRVADLENQILDENMKVDLDKIKEYAGYINGVESNVLKDYPAFEDDGNTYFQCEDQLFGITGHYKFEYFEGKITTVRFTWIPSDWLNDEEYVVECLKKCFGDFTGYSELLDDEWFCYSWEETTDENLKVSYYITEDEGEIIIRVK